MAREPRAAGLDQQVLGRLRSGRQVDRTVGVLEVAELPQMLLMGVAAVVVRPDEAAPACAGASVTAVSADHNGALAVGGAVPTVMCTAT
ncbi:hypothetical protein OOK47_22930 [Streptomyces sp. NBC_00268]|nr:hypothetical protein [Streptomyces sp. NBC_00268]